MPTNTDTLAALPDCHRVYNPPHPNGLLPETVLLYTADQMRAYARECIDGAMKADAALQSAERGT